MSDLSLATEVRYVRGVGPRFEPAFKRLGIETVGDLIFNLPRRYEDRRNLPPISRLRPGDFATVKGMLIAFDARPLRGGKTLLRAVINDGSGSVALVWFNQPWIARKLASYEGEVIAYGPVKVGSRGLEMSVQEWEILDEDTDPEDFARIMPVYGLTEGLPQKVVRKAMEDAMPACIKLVPDAFPDAFLDEFNLSDIQQALIDIHFPETMDSAMYGRRRIVFEEFFYLQLALAMNRADTAAELGIRFPIQALIKGERPVLEMAESQASIVGRKTAVSVVEGPPATLFEEASAEGRDGVPLWEQVHAMLPFTLTGAQQRVIQEIWNDMARPHPMNRLVQGDVGSGKTAVAACAMLAAVRSGYQAALMAPTEILAEQHATNLRRLFEPLNIDITLHVGKLKTREREHARRATATGAAGIVVGTHALIEEGVEFRNLGLVVVDEQHRFGVLQRAALRDKGTSLPDVLVMTATPIPRTLTMTVFGELDVSVIDALPPGRKPIKTHAKGSRERESVYSAVRKLIDEGRQAYVVCPLVSESETMQAQAAEEVFAELSRQIFPDLKLGLLHGKLKPAEKEAVMDEFRKGNLHLLVATTVIEVGVDVPNANVIVIEDANRFGLSQLHQLRGRVGRGADQSYCILVADATNEDSRARLDVMVRTTDGFVIAEEDLRLRGPGDVIGTRQSGPAEFRYGNLVQDGLLMQWAREAALDVVEADPTLSGPEWRLAAERVKERRSKLAMVAIS